MKAGKFREDLFYRLQVMPIALPPLRERRGDVPLLANYYIDRFNSEFRKRVRGLSPAAADVLEQYGWPGNVRELRNAIERAMLLIEGDWLEPEHFTTLTRTVNPTQFRLPPEGVNLDEVERQLLAAGARARRRQPDAGRAAARHQSRSGALPHREVRAQQGLTTSSEKLQAGRRLSLHDGDGTLSPSRSVRCVPALLPPAGGLGLIPHSCGFLPAGVVRQTVSPRISPVKLHSARNYALRHACCIPHDRTFTGSIRP